MGLWFPRVLAVLVVFLRGLFTLYYTEKLQFYPPSVWNNSSWCDLHFWWNLLSVNFMLIFIEVEFVNAGNLSYIWAGYFDQKPKKDSLYFDPRLFEYSLCEWMNHSEIILPVCRVWWYTVHWQVAVPLHSSSSFLWELKLRSFSQWFMVMWSG